jgi:hypothetical protein
MDIGGRESRRLGWLSLGIISPGLLPGMFPKWEDIVEQKRITITAFQVQAAGKRKATLRKDWL